MSLPISDSYTSPVDAYAGDAPAGGCDPVDKPGVLAFRKLVLAAVGGGAGGISRPCALGEPSDHHEGRAWDWSVRADTPADVARVDEVLAWLLASDAKGDAHAMLRRAGLRYILWNSRTWSVRTKDWQPYTGTNPHTDHVHFSFGWPGARGETSLYREEPQPQPPKPPNPKPPGVEPAPDSPAATASYPLAFAAGAAAGLALFWAARRLIRSQT